MTIWWLILILSFILAGGLAFIYVAIRLSRVTTEKKSLEDLSLIHI